MFDAASDTTKPAAPADSSARERMGILRRMSEIGLRMAERLDRQSELAALKAEGSVAPEAERADCARRLDEMTRAFSQVSRAVSVCIALEERIQRGPPIPEAQPLGPELVCPVPRESRLKTRRDEVQSAVREAIDACAPVNPGRIGDLCRRLDDLLDREVAAVDVLLTRPVDETIARLCARLGLEPAPASAGFQPAMRSGRPHSGNTPREERDNGLTHAAPGSGFNRSARSETANAPSSQSPSATGALPSRYRGRIAPRTLSGPSP